MTRIDSPFAYFVLAALFALPSCKTTDEALPVRTRSANAVNTYAEETQAQFGESYAFRGNRRLIYPPFTLAYAGSDRKASAFPNLRNSRQETLVERFEITAGDEKQTVDWRFDAVEPAPVAFQVGGQTFSLMVDSHQEAPRTRGVPLSPEEEAALREGSRKALKPSQLIYPESPDAEGTPAVEGGPTPMKRKVVDEGVIIQPVATISPPGE